MRIGIVPVFDRSQGGIYQYSRTMLSTLHQWQRSGQQHELLVFSDEPDPDDGQWSIKPLHPPTLAAQAKRRLRSILGERLHWNVLKTLRSRLSSGSPTKRVPHPDVVELRPDVKEWLTSCAIDLMVYPRVDSVSFEAGIPYIMAIHDLQHRLQPEFPEVSADGEWESREYRFRNGARCATLLLADSEVGKQDILDCYGSYGVTADKVKVLPYLPACALATEVGRGERDRVRAIYRLPERYLFYPAQFWPHKNHLRIIQSLGLLKDRGVQPSIVLCGSHTGELRERTFHDMLTEATRLGVDPQVQYLGYVPDEDLSAIYAEAVALVMPTFFGPTNIPVLEAWAFGCPVLTSDIRGIREQVQDAGVLVDPRSVDAIADGILRIWTDPKLTSTLAERGYHRLAAYTPADFCRRLIDIVEEAADRVNARRTRMFTTNHGRQS